MQSCNTVYVTQHQSKGPNTQTIEPQKLNLHASRENKRTKKHFQVHHVIDASYVMDRSMTSTVSHTIM